MSKSNQERFPDAIIGSGAYIGSDADIESGAYIRSGAIVVAHTDGPYDWNTYEDLRSGVPVKILRYGCVILPVGIWRGHSCALLQKHAPGAPQVNEHLYSVLDQVGA